MYGQSSLRIQHINYFNYSETCSSLNKGHVLELFCCSFSLFFNQIKIKKGAVSLFFNPRKRKIKKAAPYLSKDFKLKTYSFVDKRTNNSYSSVNFAATQKDYHCLVLIITEIFFIIQII